MNVRDWPLNQIMQLPDSCFGQRWPISLTFQAANTDNIFDISEMALPEITVIWEMHFLQFGSIAEASYCVLAIGDYLPTTPAQFDAMELVFSGLDQYVGGRGAVGVGGGGTLHLDKIRQPVRTAGRRFVGRFNLVAATPTGCELVLVVSSIPTEVPDCLLSV